MPRTTRRAATTALPTATGPRRTEEEAAALMWIHYCAHKPQLVAGISGFRGAILEQLMGGHRPTTCSRLSRRRMQLERDTDVVRHRAVSP